MTVRDELEMVMDMRRQCDESVDPDEISNAVEATFDFIRDHGPALLAMVERNEALSSLVAWNIDNFRDLPLSENYYKKWLDRAEPLFGPAIDQARAGK